MSTPDVWDTTDSSNHSLDKETSDNERASQMDDYEMFVEDRDKAVRAAKKRRRRFRSSINSKCYRIGSYNIQTGANLARAIKVAKRAGTTIMGVQEIKGVKPAASFLFDFFSFSFSFLFLYRFF